MPYVRHSVVNRRKRRTSNVHRPSRTVIGFGLDPTLRQEAEETRDWLVSQGKWEDPHIIRLVSVNDGMIDMRYTFFPVTDHPEQPFVAQDIVYFLSFDAKIYSASVDGELTLFKITPSLDSENDVEYIIEKLRLIRGE